jgi:hypothetical protein
MALTSSTIGTGNTTVYTSSGSNAISTMIICNINPFVDATPTANTAKFTLYAVPSGQTLSNTNMIINAIPLTAGETLSLDQEKLVLANGDILVAKSDTAGALVMTISTLAV